jgi:methionine sulfoxide reductase heme-binding subunit
MARPVPWLPPAVWVGGALPLALIALQGARGELGANPITEALHRCGLLALVLLIAALACTPAQLLFKWTWPARVRRALGVLGFVYVSAHLFIWLVLDRGLALKEVAEDLVKRPFITIGVLDWLLLIPLAITSTPGAPRRMGFEKWKRLHRLSYVAAILGVVHFVWSQKKDITTPLLFAGVLGALFMVRLSKRKK